MWYKGILGCSFTRQAGDKDRKIEDILKTKVNKAKAVI